MDAIVETLKPGATSRAVNRAGRKVLEADGYAKYSPYAMVHNIGCLECDSPWMPEDGEFQIVEGMTVCVDVFLFQLPWGSFRIENTLAIHSDGAELLTKFNRNFVRNHFA
jgi:Xaa-Pro aminopeptidase